MAKSSTFDNQFLLLIFQGTAITGLAQNNATSPLTNLYVSLHSADPGVGGNQGTSEVVYTGYARTAVARSSAGWAVNNNTITPVSNITFTACTGGTTTATNWAVGTASSGTNQMLYTGTISPTIVISNGVTPILTTASTITES